MRRETTAAALIILATALPEAASPQATGTPTFFAPTRGFASWELGVSFSRSGDATGLEGRYGFALHRADLALRAGYVDPGPGDGSFGAGIEGRFPVLGRSASFPLDGALILGVGRRFASGGGQTYVPLGLSLGRRLRLDRELHLTPYLQPTVIFADDALLTLGLGVDLGIGDIPDIRVAWGFGDLDGWSVGLFWPR